MEALTAVTVAALTVYDMCKAVDREMTIDGVVLERKSGGRSGDYVRPGADRRDATAKLAGPRPRRRPLSGSRA